MNRLRTELKFLLFTLPVLIGLFLMRGFLFRQGIILYAEFVGSTDYFFHFKNLLHAYSGYRNLGLTNLGWPEKVGGGDVFGTVTSGGTFYWLGFLSLLQFLLGELGHKVYFLIALVLPFFTFYPLAKRLFKDRLAAFLAAFIYFFNPQILDRVRVGTLRFNLAYAFLPLLFLIYLKLKGRSEGKKELLGLILSGGLILAFVFQVMPHFLIIFAFLSGLDFVYALVKKQPINTPRLFFGFFAMGVLVLLINGFILLPAFLYPEPKITQSLQFFSLGSLIFNGQGATLPKISTLTGWPWSILRGERTALSWPEYLTMIYPILALFGLILGVLRKKTAVKFWALAAFFFLFLAKGVNPPLGRVSKLLYLNLPFLWPFRDPTKFLAALAFCFAVLAGYFLLSIRSQKTRWLVLVLVFTLLVMSNFNFFDGSFEKTVAVVNVPDSYRRLSALPVKLQKENLMALPNGLGLSHYSWYPDSQNSSVNYSPLSSLMPVQGNLTNSLLTVDTLSSRFLGYLENHLSWGRVSQALLKKAGVQLLVLDKNTKTKTQVNLPSGANLLNREIANLGLNQVWADSGLTVFENLTTNPYFYTSQNALFVVGNLDAFEQIGGLNSAYLRYPFIFLNQLDNFDKISKKGWPGEVVFANTQKGDLTGFLLLKQGFGFDLAKKVWRNLDSRKEWTLAEPYLGSKIFQEGLDFQSGGAIGTSGHLARLNFVKEIEQGQKYRLLVRPNFSPQAGKLKILIDNKVISEIDLQTKELTILRWLDLGPFDLKQGQHRFGLATKGSGEVVLDGLVLAPENSFMKTQKQVNKFLSSREVSFLYSPRFVKAFTGFGVKQSIKLLPVSGVRGPKIVYTKISPTRYNLKLKFERPTYLVFKQNFSPYWKLKENNLETSPAAADYFANVFFLSSGSFNGIIYYTPDEIYRALVLFSTLTVLFAGVFLIKLKWKTNH